MAEGKDKMFYSRQERLEWQCASHKSTAELYAMYNGAKSYVESEDKIRTFHISEETFGCATSLFGFCSRRGKPYKFSISANKISSKLSTTFHHHARGKTLALNYQLSAAIQQMGCGPADIITLCGFLGLPGKSIKYHIKEVEHTLGKMNALLEDMNILHYLS